MVMSTPEAALTVETEATFYSLYHRESPVVLRYLYARVRDITTAEDLCSDTFCRAWDSWSRFGGDDSAAGAWVMRIARNRLIDHLRHNRRLTFEELDESHAASGGPEKAATGRIYLRRALAGLSTEERDLMAMRIAGMSHAEIGKVQGRSEEAVKKAWQRALLKARSNLEADA
jgi:RNA polymerase sigma-70 factor (ECF subfamily)